MCRSRQLSDLIPVRASFNRSLVGTERAVGLEICASVAGLLRSAAGGRFFKK